MMIFNAKDGALTEYFGNDEYYNAEVIEGGYHYRISFFAILKVHGGDEMSFAITEPSVYDKIVAAYISKETIGLVL